MEEIRIADIRTGNCKQTISLSGIVSKINRPELQVESIIFECPECGSRIIIKQENGILHQPRHCECGRRGDFLLLDKKLVDVGYMIISQCNKNSIKVDTISIISKEEKFTKPDEWEKFKVGSKVRIIGKTDFIYNRDKIESVSYYIEPISIEILSELEIEEKEQIVLDYMKHLIESKIDKIFVQQMKLRGIEVEDLTEIIENLIKKGKINPSGKNRISLQFVDAYTEPYFMSD